MIELNIHEAKTHLSRHLEALERGETIVLCRRNQPIAEIRALPKIPAEPRPTGLDKGKFTVGPEFFEPMPDDFLAFFRGKR
jgi:antitoxin (DNA-binding transcriptional repressor) of toxin-antitoxin stability system